MLEARGGDVRALRTELDSANGDFRCLVPEVERYAENSGDQPVNFGSWGYVIRDFYLEVLHTSSGDHWLVEWDQTEELFYSCLLYTSPSPRD